METFKNTIDLRNRIESYISDTPKSMRWRDRFNEDMDKICEEAREYGASATKVYETGIDEYQFMVFYNFNNGYSFKPIKGKKRWFRAKGV